MPGKMRLPAQARELSRLTRELARCCQGKDEQIFGQFHLSTAEGRVLLCIADCTTTTPSAMADKLRLGRSRLTPLVESLVNKGLISRVESEQDRRVRTLKLTAAGTKCAQEATAFLNAFHEELLRCFNSNERHALLESLTQLQDAIEVTREKMAETIG
jgi:DNA-binding MarR family transcriptional regulator